MPAVSTYIYIYLFINLQFQYCVVQIAISFFIVSVGCVATSWYSKNTHVYSLILCSQINYTFGDTVQDTNFTPPPKRF